MTKSLRIIVVDDDVAMLEAISNMLKNEGFDVNAFSNPKDALKYFLENGSDLIITDFDMPGMSGAKLIKEIRKNNPRMKFIGMSGDVTREKFFLSAGANGFFQKPSSRKNILMIVNNYLKR